MTSVQSSSTTSLAHDTIVPSLPLSRKQSCVPTAGLDEDVSAARRVCAEYDLDEEVREVLTSCIGRFASSVTVLPSRARDVSRTHTLKSYACAV